MSVIKTITAKSKGEVVGTKDVEWPSNLAEAVEMDTEAKVFDLYSQAKVVSERASLYPKTASAGSISKKSVYDKMIAAGVDESIALSVSGYNPDA